MGNKIRNASILEDEQFRRILNGLQEGVYAVDKQHRITFWNGAAERITGYTADEVTGLSCGKDMLMHMDSNGREMCSTTTCPLTDALSGRRYKEKKIYLHHRSGHRLPVFVRVFPVQDEKGEITGAVEVFSEITSRLRLEERIGELQKMALLDPVTELPNRRYLEGQINSRVEELKRYGNRFGVLYMDIDHFKMFNDRYGHDKGDQVLKVVSRTLSFSVRASDVVGRWGGEEFMGVFPNIDREKLFLTGQRLLALIARSRIKQGGEELSVTVSIGGAYARGNDTRDSIIKRADARMYESKEKGRNTVTMGNGPVTPRAVPGV